MARLAQTIACLLALAPALATAQILIGQTSDFSGPTASGVRENVEGARLWIDHVNRQGGIHGQRVELVSLDDRFQPTQAVANARVLITERRVLALFLNRGTAHAEALRPLLAEHGVPLVAPSTGASSLHKPVHRWIFNVRASYQRETQRIVTLLSSMGMRRIALVHVNDQAGLDGAGGALQGFAEARLEPVFVHSFDRERPDHSQIAAGVVRSNAQAVVFLGSAAAVSQGTKAIRGAGSRAQVVTASNNASAGFVTLMGEHARGTIVSQVFPHERALGVPFVRQAHELAIARGLQGVTPAMLEGFAAAKVLMEGLRRAGPQPTRLALRDALEGIERFDLGGPVVSYGPDDHTGMDSADLSVVGADGTFRR